MSDISVSSLSAYLVLCNVTKKIVEKFVENGSCRVYGVTNYVNFFEKLCEKRLKYVLFFYN